MQELAEALNGQPEQDRGLLLRMYLDQVELLDHQIRELPQQLVCVYSRISRR